MLFHRFCKWGPLNWGLESCNGFWQKKTLEKKNQLKFFSKPDKKSIYVRKRIPFNKSKNLGNYLILISEIQQGAHFFDIENMCIPREIGLFGSFAKNYTVRFLKIGFHEIPQNKRNDSTKNIGWKFTRQKRSRTSVVPLSRIGSKFQLATIRQKKSCCQFNHILESVECPDCAST